jgi:hypothetical protein
MLSPFFGLLFTAILSFSRIKALYCLVSLFKAAKADPKQKLCTGKINKNSGMKPCAAHC